MLSAATTYVLVWPRGEGLTALPWIFLLVAGVAPVGFFGLMVANKTPSLLFAVPISLVPTTVLAYVV